MRKLLALLTLITTVGIASTASAATYEVTKRGDPPPGPCTANDCSLREAVLAANASVGVADRIVLPSRRAYRLLLPGDDDGAAMGDLDLSNDRVTIVHPGRGRAIIDANRLDRAFDVYAPANLVKLEIVEGEDDYGGAIRGGAPLTVRRSVVRDNTALQCGGGIHTQDDPDASLDLVRSRVVGNRSLGNGGGLSVSCFGGSGPVTIARSTIANNRSDSNSTGNGYGGGIYLQADSGVQSTITNSTIAGNRNGPGGIGAADGGGLYTDLGRLRITGSTISGNRSGDVGGGIQIDGTEPFQMTNSTVSGNRANDNGGGISLDSGIASLNAVTVVRNHGNADQDLSEAGGGLWFDEETFRVRNSLIALNTLGALTPGDPPVKNDCAGVDPFSSQGNNLLSTRFLCEGFDAGGDMRRKNPRIGKLARNGGPTRTVALKAGSPAIGEAGRASSPPRDQRGRKRDRRPDIGAFER